MGTEIEMLTFAHLTNTNVYSYRTVEHIYSRDHATRSVYIKNSYNVHFEVVVVTTESVVSYACITVHVTIIFSLMQKSSSVYMWCVCHYLYALEESTVKLTFRTKCDTKVLLQHLNPRFMAWGTSIPVPSN